MLKHVCFLWMVLVVACCLLCGTPVEPELFADNKSESKSKSSGSQPMLGPHQKKLIRVLMQQRKRMPSMRQTIKMQRATQRLQEQVEPIYYSFAPKATDDATAVNLLWSGGVASTYRLCQLLFVYKRKVRPIFMAQRGLDERTSSYQERLTVRTLHQYIHDHYPSTKDSLLPLHMYDTSLPKSSTNRQTIEVLASVFLTQPHRVAPFYLALANLHNQLHKPHTELSARPVEIVLPVNGPHQLLRDVVEQWGARAKFDEPERSLAEWFGEAKDTTPPDERAISQCTYIVHEPTTVSSHTHQRQSAFAKLFRHIRFVLPCDSPPVMHKTAQKHRFQKVLHRAWTCREPTKTARQDAHPATNNTLQLPTVPVRPCGRCVSCRQRAWDGIARVDTG